MSDNRPPGTLGADLRKPGLRPCGLCGEVREMTRAHVPPQAAGNRGMVTSATVRIHNRIRSTGRPTAGGMWLRGLCGDCNSLAGANYDTAYGDFAIAEDVQRHLPHGGSDHHVLGLAEGLLAMFQHTIDERLTDPDAATPTTPRATGRHS